MTIPAQHNLWVRAIKNERPWDDNETTRELLVIVGDQDLAAVIWAIEQTNAVKWLSFSLPALGGKSPSSLLSTSSGRLQLWSALEAAIAWL